MCGKSFVGTSVAWALLVSLSAAGAATAPPPDPGPVGEQETASEPAPTLDGRVLTPAGDPVAGATVRARGYETGDKGALTATGKPVEGATAEDGRFSFEGPGGDVVRLRVEADGWAPWWVAQHDPAEPFDVVLGPGRDVAGRVLAAADGKPVRGVEVKLRDEGLTGFSGSLVAETDEEGVYRFSHVASGEAWLDYHNRTFAAAHQSRVSVPEVEAGANGQPPDVFHLDDVYLEPGGRLAGTIVDIDGEPLSGAMVRARVTSFSMADGMGGQIRGTARSDDEGGFAFDGLPVAPAYRLDVAKDGYPSAWAGPFVVERGTDLDDIVVRVGHGARLRATLRGPDGPPAADTVDARLRPTGESAGGDVMAAYAGLPVDDDDIGTDAEGRTTIDRVAPGGYTVEIDVEGFRPITVDDVVLHEGDTRDLGEFVLDPGASIAGHVTDPSGEPLAEVRVKAMWKDRERRVGRTTRTDQAGAWRIGGLADTPVDNLALYHEGYASLRLEDVQPGRDDVDVELAPAGGIRGMVRSRDGAPLAGFKVMLRHEKKGPFSFPQRPKPFDQPGGPFEMPNVSAGVYTVEVTAAGMAPGRVRGVEVAEGETTDVGEIVLQPGLALHGLVVSAEDGSAIAGATVKAAAATGVAGMLASMLGTDITATSGEDGTFSVDGLEPGAVRLSVDHSAYAPATRNVTLAADTPPEEVVVELARSGSIAGTVLDGDGLPVVGVRIMVTSDFFNGRPQIVTTGPDGTYRIDRLAPGAQMVARMPEDPAAGIAGYEMRSATVTSGKVTIVDFDESPAILLSGTVRRGEKPLPGAKLLLVPSTGGSGGLEVKSIESDGQGRYEVGLSRPGRYRVQVIRSAESGSFGGMSMVEIDVPDEPQPVRDIVMRAVAISGIVLGDSDEPVANATVVASPQNADALSQDGGMGRTAVDGRYTLDGMAPGSYTVSVSAKGYAAARRLDVAVTEDAGADDVDFDLDRGRTIRGRVVDPSGAPVAGAMIWVSPTDAPGAISLEPQVSDDTGAFEAAAPVDVPSEVTVAHPAWASKRAAVPPGDGGETPPLVIRLDQGGTLVVEVVGEDGRRRSGVAVAAMPVLPSLQTAVGMSRFKVPVSDASGVARVEHLPEGDYAVQAVGADETRTRTRVVADVETHVTLTVGD